MKPAPRIHDRTDKVRSRRRRMPVQGRALKRLLIERANKAQAQKPKAS
jgi:hypothetical protein